MDNKKNGIPKLRFPGFTGAWEQRKLGEGTLKIGDGLHGTPKYSTSGNVLFINGNNLINGKVVITSETKRVTSNEQSKDDKELNQNTILMSINGTIGSLAWYRNENLMLGKSVAYIEVSEFDKKFVYAYLQTTKVKFYFISSLTGTTIKNLGLKAIRETPLLIPNIEEQEKIGEFFQQLDSLIALHQRKLEHLQEQKKGLLQKMFPKNGETVPEVRFPGFTDAWEQRKLGDLAEIVRGASPRPISDPKWFDDNSDIGWLRISDVTNQNGRIYYLEQHISKLGQEKTRVITEPHLLLSIAATVGKPLINYIKTGVHDGFLIFLNPKFDLEYMYQWLEMFRPKWNKYGQPGSQVNLNSNLVRKQKIALPSREEQQRISSFLKQLDSLIALHQRKLEHLELMKKGLLQQMFV
ncbi:restriction endonuclease subunit S [Ligilactobacillus salivarius]|uniref:restriction endonuclease subunit S n=2 Tax=Ligilactobacillus TaxID=2767887 RepID=UPI0009DA8F54|nr:restriction endonuclease subunit S [Ligilactobacillus salivarius]OQR16953.1 restriction endonuclease subunit S [Ligilactobacillus salivarius]